MDNEKLLEEIRFLKEEVADLRQVIKNVRVPQAVEHIETLANTLSTGIRKTDDLIDSIKELTHSFNTFRRNN